MRMLAPQHWEKLGIVRCALDLGALPPRAARRTAAGPVRAICVGRLSAEKGHVGLLQAFAKARLRGARDSELVLVGDGPEKARIERFARNEEAGAFARSARKEKTSSPSPDFQDRPEKDRG